MWAFYSLFLTQKVYFKEMCSLFKIWVLICHFWPNYFVSIGHTGCNKKKTKNQLEFNCQKDFHSQFTLINKRMLVFFWITVQVLISGLKFSITMLLFGRTNFSLVVNNWMKIERVSKFKFKSWWLWMKNR